MNSLKRLKINTLYSTHDEIKNFYSSVLGCACIYKRVSAYFNSNVFSFLRKGLPEFIKNKGYMQLVLSSDLTPEIIKEINAAYYDKEKQKIYLKNNEEIFNIISDICLNGETNIFSYLIACGKLEIKIGFKKSGILHDKFGCISDGINNLVYIGSGNFTSNAIDVNDEAFQVTIDWDNPSNRELDVINKTNILFNDYWNNNKEDVVTLELPDPIITKMIDNIDYEDVKSYVEKPNFIRIDIQNDILELFSNYDLDKILTYKNIGEYINFIEKNGDKFYLKNISRIDEQLNFINIIDSYCKTNNFNFCPTLLLNKYLELNVRNYDELEKKGNYIKNVQYNKTDEFQEIKNTINAIIKRPLKDQQVIGASHIINIGRSLNFSVPGSGKTSTVLGAFEYLNNLPIYDSKYVNKLLIIGPVNCSKSWRDEYSLVSSHAKEHAPLNIVDCGDGIYKNDVLIHDFPTSRVIIINYEIINKLSDDLSNLVDEKTMIVFDEIHRIKSTDSMKYDSIKKIVKKTKFRIALTGTPLPNGYIDLYNMISLLHDDYCETYFNMFKSYLKKYDSNYKKSGLQNSDLNEKLYPFYIRVNKNDLEVPLAEPDNIIYIDTNKKEKELYFEFNSKCSNEFERTIKLTEIGCCPFKCSEIDDNGFDYNLLLSDYESFITSKIAKFLSIISKDRKCVVWCRFVDTIKIITFILNKKGYAAYSIYGDTEQSVRDKIIDDFNFTNNVDIIVTNPATLAESVSLHKSCHEAHYLELDYNLYQFLQSKDRIHRLGLKENDKTNYYIYLNFYDEKQTISEDKKIYDSLLKKEHLMKKSIDNGNFIFGDDYK